MHYFVSNTKSCCMFIYLFIVNNFYGLALPGVLFYFGFLVFFFLFSFFSFFFFKYFFLICFSCFFFFFCFFVFFFSFFFFFFFVFEKFVSEAKRLYFRNRLKIPR